MIARHDPILGLSLSLPSCLSFLTPLPRLLILISLSLSLFPSTSSPSHTESVLFCRIFIVSLHLLSQHHLHAFILSLFSLWASLILTLSYVCILYFSICLSSTTYYFFFSTRPPSSSPFFSMFLFLSTRTTCVKEGNMASSGPCWTITMQSNPNRDVCRKQHVCNYCLMRPLSQAECPIKLPMRKQCQGLLKKEKKEEERVVGRVRGK